MASQLLIDESPLLVLPTLATQLGLKEAIVLQQVHYWLNPKFNKNFFEGCHWVHNTYAQWQAQFPFWGDKTIRRTISNLEESRLLVSFVTKDLKKMKYYSIDYRHLRQMDVSMTAKVRPKLYSVSTATTSGQTDQTEGTKRPRRSGQVDQIDLVNMTTSYNKDTETTTTEITLPPTSFMSNPRRKDEEDKDISQKMIEVWNKKVQSKIHPNHPVHLTKRRAKKLREAFHSIFKNHINAWEDYCAQIASCQFLLGHNASGFRVNLDWALREKNIRKVLEKAFYDKPAGALEQDQTHPQPKNVPTQETFLQAVEKRLSHNTLSDNCRNTWILICQDLGTKFPPQTCLTWFTHITPVDLSGSEAILQVDSSFVRDYLRIHYGPELEKSIRYVCSQVSKIKFQVHLPQQEKGN